MPRIRRDAATPARTGQRRNALARPAGRIPTTSCLAKLLRDLRAVANSAAAGSDCQEARRALADETRVAIEMVQRAMRGRRRLEQEEAQLARLLRAARRSGARPDSQS